MERERELRVGICIVRAYGELESRRARASWEEKLEACAYVRHRDCYAGTLVPDVKLYSSSPELYFGKYVSGIVGYLFPRSQQWAKWVPDLGYGKSEMSDGHAMVLDDELAKTLEALDSMTFTALSRSNFYSEVRHMMNDWAAMGVGCISAFDRGTAIPAFRSEDPQSFVIDDDEYREVDCYIRRFRMNASRCVRIYGGKARLEATRKMAVSGSHLDQDEVELYEAVFARGYFTDPGTGEEMAFGGHGRYVHLVWSETDREILLEKGYEELPMAVVCRNRDSEKCFYGHGLAEDCLPDMRMLNDAENRKQIALQKISDPPMVVPYSMEGAFSSKPRAVNYTPDIGQRPMPMQAIQDYSGIVADVAEREERLKYKMDVTLFEAVMSSGDSRKTATEVTMKENKSILLLALNIDNLLQEMVDPIMRRTLKIIVRNATMDGVKKDGLMRLIDTLHVEMNSVFVKRLNAYIQAEGLVGSLQNLQVLASFAPSSIQAIDTDKYARLLLTASGLPATLFKSERDLQREREEQAEIQQRQLSLQEEQMQAKANADNSKAYQALGGMGAGGGNA